MSSSNTATATNWHGYLLAAANLPPPTCVTPSDELARPSYTKIKSAEFIDSREVLEVKADVLIQMWKAAQRPLVYAGAGISTSAGIQDYASNAAKSAVQAPKMKLTMANILALRPTLAHRVITALEKAGMVWGWLQQNHDGLAQKAGFPAHKVNELHGSWLDSRANPIIKMSGSLRGDLFEWKEQMEEMCDFVFAAGTSFSGLNADSCACECANRHMSRRQGQGIAIISIQQTPVDDLAALRIFAKIDDFMRIVADKMMLTIDEKLYAYAAAPLPVGPLADDAWLKERASRRAVFEAETKNKIAALQPRPKVAEESKRPSPPKPASAAVAPAAAALPPIQKRYSLSVAAAERRSPSAQRNEGKASAARV